MISGAVFIGASDDLEVNEWGMYYSFAKNFGFTPQQVDEIPAVILRAMNEFQKVANEKEESEMKKSR